MLRVGLTGGMAAGKSTVARMLARLGACVVDADELVHEILDGDEAVRAAIVERFGKTVLGASGRIDRARLGRLVFGDAGAREALESLVHPAVRAEATRRFRTAAVERGSRIGVFDAALLVETGVYRDLHRLIVVRCPRETQLRRLASRAGLARADAEARLAAQAPLERQLDVADYVIDTDVPLEQTRRRTSAVFDCLLADFDREFGESTS